jgi:hypothetical protein
LRPAGWLLFIAGFLLCLTVVWAALGFLLMGVGLVALLAAESRRKRLAAAIEVKTVASAPAAETVVPASPPPARKMVLPPSAPVSPPPIRPEPSPLKPPVLRSAPVPLTDAEKWRILLASDADVARLAAALAPYGQKYVDRLASAYLREADSSRLPEVINRIVEAARNDAKQNADATVAPPAEPVAPPAVEEDPVERHIVETVDEVPPADAEAAPRPSARQRLLDSVIPADELAHAAPDEVKKSETRAGRGSTIVAADDDLTDLLGSFTPNPALRREPEF